MDVDDTLNPPQSTTTVKGPFTNITVVTIDANVVHLTKLASAINPNDNFTIASLNGQSVINAAGGCEVTVSGSANNAPIVEAKQLKKKRRYVVTNAEPIQSITGNVNGAAVNINTAGNLYTTLVLT